MQMSTTVAYFNWFIVFTFTTDSGLFLCLWRKDLQGTFMSKWVMNRDESLFMDTFIRKLRLGKLHLYKVREADSIVFTNLPSFTFCLLQPWENNFIIHP